MRHDPEIASAAVSAQTPECLPAVHARKREIHQHQVRANRLGLKYASRAVSGLDDLVAGSLQ